MVTNLDQKSISQKTTISRLKMHKNWMQHHNEENAPLEQLWDISKDYKQDYEPNVALGLSKLKARIAQDQVASTTTKVITFNRLKWMRRIAATIAFLLTCGFLFNYFVNQPSTIQQLTTTDTTMENVVLPDGSTVWVNRHSQLSFPETFDGATRTIQLKGEAFFQVAKNPSQPFIIQMSNSEIKVLGTAFNVRAYPKENTTSVEVAEGKVAFIATETKEKVVLNANDKIILNHIDATLSERKALSWTTTAWKAKQLNFEDDQPISEIANYLATNFAVELDYDKEKLGDCPFNSTLVKNTPEAILKRIDSTFPSIKLKEVHSKYYQLSGTCD